MSSLTLAYIRQQLAQGVPPGNNNEESVWWQWKAALATLQEDFLISSKPNEGLWLAAPFPIFCDAKFLEKLNGWTWTPIKTDHLFEQSVPCLSVNTQSGKSKYLQLPLTKADGDDPFLILITPQLQIALAIHGPPSRRQLLVRTDSVTISRSIEQLYKRIYKDSPTESERLRSLMGKIIPPKNNEKLAQLFWPQLAQRLAMMGSNMLAQHINTCPEEKQNELSKIEAHQSELALLEAITHEVRTPLATIRTLIRSLLRRSDLATVVKQRLIQIDGECSEQIDRFGLIFHAAELQRQPETLQQLARTNLSELLLQLKPIWQQQLERRGLRLIISITPELPEVLSDPSRLETMLGGLVARYSRSLNSSQTVQLSLTPAGTRLKLQLGCESQNGNMNSNLINFDNKQACLNPVLTWNPTTGSLQLSQEATQRLFHSLGGQVSEGSGNGLIVFFPLAEEIC